MSDGQEIVEDIVEHAIIGTEGMSLSLARQPEDVIEEATRAAKALKHVVESRKKEDGTSAVLKFGGEIYLRVEDWQTVARFYGCTVLVTTTEYVQFGDVHGFQATAEVIDQRTGNTLSRGDAMCLSDEEKWSARPKYEYRYVRKSGGSCAEDPGPSEIVWEPNPFKPGKNRPKKERVHVGEERVPLFQLRSMAQTRACGKALRNVFSWVVVLAGYQPTPAEEMDGVQPDTEHSDTPLAEPQRTSEDKAPAPTQREDGKLVFAKVKIDNMSQKTSPPDAEKPWTKYGIKIGDTWVSTFDHDTASAASTAKKDGTPVTIVYERKGQFFNLVSLVVHDDLSGDGKTESDGGDIDPELGF